MPGLYHESICSAGSSEGYIQVFLDGGLNQQRMGVCVGLELQHTFLSLNVYWLNFVDDVVFNFKILT